MKKKDKIILKQIGLGLTFAAVGIKMYKLIRNNKESIYGEGIEEISIKQYSEVDEDIENIDVEQITFGEDKELVNDEFISPIVDKELDTEEEYKEYMIDRFGENAYEMMEKIESISSYAEIYMESGYEHGSNYHDGPYYIEYKDNGLGSEIAYDLYTDEYIGGDPFDLVEEHENDGFPEHHWE